MYYTCLTFCYALPKNLCTPHSFPTFLTTDLPPKIPTQQMPRRKVETEDVIQSASETSSCVFFAPPLWIVGFAGFYEGIEWDEVDEWLLVVGCLFGWLVGWLFVCLFVCLLVCLFVCLLLVVGCCSGCSSSPLSINFSRAQKAGVSPQGGFATWSSDRSFGVSASFVSLGVLPCSVNIPKTAILTT